MSIDPRDLCEHCRTGAPHHTVGFGAIGATTRYTVWDIHEISDASGVGLAECTAAYLYEPLLVGAPWID
jgi:hypothetical protein